MKERRKMERFDLKLPATVELLSPDQEYALRNLHTNNICAGGAYFQTAQPLPVGTQVKIDLILLLDRLKRLKEEFRKASVKVTGTVLRSESEGMAVRFDEDYEIIGAPQRPPTNEDL